MRREYWCWARASGTELQHSGAHSAMLDCGVTIDEQCGSQRHGEGMGMAGGRWDGVEK